MTDSYNQSSINVAGNPEALEIQSYDFRQIGTFVPSGTTASIQGLKIPSSGMLTRLAWVSVVGPAAGETVALRLFRIRPANNPSGFGFIQLNSTFTVSTATFPGAGVESDISSTIIDNLFVFEGEYLACSWVQSGPQTMQPLNMNWNIAPCIPPDNWSEPSATTTVYADVFG